MGNRVILHSDMNCFYASVEMMLNPRLRGKPVAVCGSSEDRHGIVLAKSQLAKQAGVKTGMVNWEAKRCCPGLIVVPPQYDQYLKYSRLARAIYGRFTDQVEPYGIQLIFAAIGGWLGYFLGGCDGLLYALIAFVVIDYLTGIMCAISDHTLSSEVGFRGICRKVLIFLLVGIANVLDIHVLGNGSVLRTAVIFFYISNEGVSLLENAAHLGLPVPEKVKDVLEQLHGRAEGDEQ